MSKFALITALIVMFTGPVQAQESRTRVKKSKKKVSAKVVESQFFYQAQDGTFVVTPGMEYNSVRGQLADRSGDVKDVGPTYNMKFEYGFTKNFATSLKLGYLDGEQTTPDLNVGKSGMTDMLMTLKGRMKTARHQSFNYGTFVKHSVDRTKKVNSNFDLSMANNIAPYESDAHSAGSSLTPFIGYQSRIGRGVGGVQLMQTIWGAPRNLEITTYGTPVGTVKSEFEETGGGVTDFRAFYEHPINQMDLGVTFKFRHHTKVERENKATGEVSRVTDRLNLMGFIISPTIKMSKNAELVSSLSFMQLLETNVTYSGQNVQQGEMIDASVGARFSF